jgi:gliding motility-associated-like protein
MKKLFLIILILIFWSLDISAQIIFIPPAPSISSQPISPVSYCRNIQASIPFSASGLLLTYQWSITGPPGCEFCDSPLTNNSTYSGTNTSSLGINTGLLAPGTYYYFCTVSNTGGTVYTNTVQFTVLTTIVPNAPATTGSSLCGNGTVTLSAAGGTAGQYRWYTVASGGTAIAGQTNATYTTPTLTGTTNYYVALNNGLCEGPRSIVTATINTIPSAPTTTGSSLCGNGTVTLSAAGGTAGQYRWYTVPTGGTAIAGQTNSTYTTPVITGTTTYYVSINNGTCESTRTSVVATINTPPTAPTTTGNSACGSSAVTINTAGAAAGQYRWYTVPTGGTAIAGQTNSAYTTPVITGTTTYYVSINNGTCESTRTSVVATINTPPTAPTTTGNSACGSSAVTVNAAGAAAGQYRWYTVPTGGTAIAGQTNSAYTTPVITGTTTYYVSINNGTCESTRASVVATINTPPSAPTTTGNSACGSSAVTINAAGAAAGQYRWYTVPTGGTAIAGQTNNTYTTPVITGTTTYYVSINNGTCESTRTSVVAIINNLPTAPATAGGSACGPISITLNASGGTAGQYRWYTVPTGGTAITGETNSMYQTPIISTTTNYYVSINDGTCESTRTAVTATILTTGCNTIPPTISPVPLTTIVAGKITLDLVPLIVAPGVLNVNNITIVTPPSSGASASISNGILTINYAGKAFTGTESIVIRACDESSLCTEQTFTIEVAGDIKVYNGMSPNNDKKNEIFFIQYIDVIPGMAKNTVSIYNRWGSVVFEITDYNNTTRVFKGLGNNGEELPSGTYFYKIAFEKLEGRTGYFVIKR